VLFRSQQGTRLQWVDTDTFAFNDLSDDRSHYVARTASVDRRTLVRCYDRPLQDGYKHDYFLSLNYRRLRALRPDYGYFSLPRLTASECENLDDDGIWTVDYDTGAETLIYTLQQIRDHKPQPEFDTSVHYVNHCMIAPGGDRFVFLHRYIDAGGRRIDRLFVGGRSGDSPELLVDTGFISHYCWVDDHTLLGYMRGRDETDGYYTVDVDTGAMLPVLNRRLDGNGDGHPSVCGSKFVIDTYPSKGRMQTLLLVDRDDQSVREIAEFRHGLQYDAETRCDLHPRLSPDGTSVFFDSVFSGTRKQYRMPLAAEATS